MTEGVADVVEWSDDAICFRLGEPIRELTLSADAAICSWPDEPQVQSAGVVECGRITVEVAGPEGFRPVGQIGDACVEVREDVGVDEVCARAVPYPMEPSWKFVVTFAPADDGVATIWQAQTSA